ncbi:MAG TPA: cupin-like domain-containing protein [Rhizomicrobium sp.]|nr:cupin-like domain-containing protein [Rhizomicrobium sp.]
MAPRPIREWNGSGGLDEIVADNEPVVLRGLVRDWPAVEAGASPKALSDYLLQFDSGHAVRTLIGPPSIQGRFFYRDDMKSLNFERREEGMRAALERLIATLDDPAPPALAIQAASAKDHFPGFAERNSNPLLGARMSPRLWIGNRITVATHFDPMLNIACVAAGRRRFTLFPPEEIANLYVGPLDLTPAGAPVSLVSVTDPELDRFPKFAHALAAARTAELAPGDAIYIPYLWWHHVESLERFNVLVNYWWDPAPETASKPFSSIFHAMLAISALPADQRSAWRAFFDHYVFRLEGEPGAHLPAHAQGLIAPMSPDLARQMRAMLRNALK